MGAEGMHGQVSGLRTHAQILPPVHTCEVMEEVMLSSSSISSLMSSMSLCLALQLPFFWCLPAPIEEHCRGFQQLLMPEGTQTRALSA